MIDYETFCKIRDYHGKQGLKAGQIARALELDQRTVSHWINAPRYLPRQAPPRASKLDPYKRLINQWLGYTEVPSSMDAKNRQRLSGSACHTS